MKSHWQLLESINAFTRWVSLFVTLNLAIGVIGLPFVFGLLFVSKTSGNLMLITLSSFTIGPAIVASIRTMHSFIHNNSLQTLRYLLKTIRVDWCASLMLSTLHAFLNTLLYWNFNTIILQTNITFLLIPTAVLAVIINLILIDSYLFLSQFTITIHQALLDAIIFIFQAPWVNFRTLILILGYISITAHVTFPPFIVIYFSIPIFLLVINTKDILDSIKEQGENAKNSTS